MDDKPRREKFRNEPRKAFTRNFSTYVIDRYIMIDNDLMNETQQNNFIRKVNEKLWHAIQEVNMLVEDRILPFVQVRRLRIVDDKLRVVVNDYDSLRKLSNYEETEELDMSSVSHLINFKPLSPLRHVMISDNLIPGDAKMLIDQNELTQAAVDIFLDIAMFNSYSFLQKLSLKSKKEFNNKKYNYFVSAGLSSYYDIDEANPPAYFSFAFYARKDSKNIDFDKYVWVWKNFVSTFSKSGCKVQRPEKQIKDYHRDVQQIEDRYLSNEFWDSQESGAKLLLKINREPNTDERKRMISDYFGVYPFRLNAIKVVPLSEYFKPFVHKQLEELYISAFKIIV